MPALFYPNLDVLRLALTSGVVPAALSDAAARGASDDYGRVWIEAPDLPSREVLSALMRLGVRAHAEAPLALANLHGWAELLPLRPNATATGGVPDIVLFEASDTAVVPFTAALRR